MTSIIHSFQQLPNTLRIKQLLTVAYVGPHKAGSCFLPHPHCLPLSLTHAPPATLAIGSLFLIKLRLFLPQDFFFWSALDLCCCVRAFSICSEQGLLFIAVHGLLIAVASLVAEHGLEVCRLQ